VPRRTQAATTMTRSDRCDIVVMMNPILFIDEIENNKSLFLSPVSAFEQ
jgi:hypothetical protein